MPRSILADSERRVEVIPSPLGRVDAPATFRNVLVGVDGTSSGRDAIALAQNLCDEDGRLTLAHVVLVLGPVYGNFASTGAGKEARQMLERERAAAEAAAHVTGMFAPSVGAGLHQLAADVGADLLVVGSSDRSAVSRVLRGDATRATLTGATCPVAVAPRDYAERATAITTIGVAYDGSPESEIALIGARALATRHGAGLRALTVVWPTSSGAWPGRPMPLAGAWGLITLDALERRASERVRPLSAVPQSVTVGPPADELLAFADQVDLLVVGSRGHGPLRRLLLGSTSACLARTARSPLLVIPRRVRPK